ncbi:MULTISPECIES: hypothetical protein [unclassified Burkholderia]|uniref:hypothetical protein n=1 Tax=unclassified Burkholderia TaxID=2613784 RepID=UPI00158A6B53|nr:MULTISPECIES: hypothetical protein [unclassified Burkholderia]
MPSHRNRSFRNGLRTIGLLLALAPALVVTGAETNNESHGKIKPPPLPIGSTQVVVKPGMSDEEWEKAYKETGRPKFDRKLVKKHGGNVERD